MKASVGDRLSDPARVRAFSDGVFAIIITLLVLDLRVPDHKPGELAAALAGRWPVYLAFAVSFLYIGALWLNHHALFRHIGAVDLGLHWLNLGLLFATVLIPFPTSVLASTFDADVANRHDQRVAVALYTFLAMLMSAIWGGVWAYLARHGELLVEPGETVWARAQLRRPLTGVALFSAGGLAGWFISPVIGLVSIVAMIIYHAFTSEGVPVRR